MFLRMRFFCVLFTLFSTLAIRRADADLIISPQDSNMDAADTGFVNVSIASDGIDMLDLASYEFQITPLGMSASSLSFLNPQIETEDTNNTLYWAHGDSFGMTTDSLAPTQFSGSDLTSSGTGVLIDSTPKLLIRLDVQHMLGSGQSIGDALGDQFSISLVNSPNTFFDDPNFDPLSISPTSFTNLGVVTIGAAVPEPSSIFLVSASALPFLLRRSS